MKRGEKFDKYIIEIEIPLLPSHFGDFGTERSKLETEKMYLDRRSQFSKMFVHDGCFVGRDVAPAEDKFVMKKRESKTAQA